MSFTPVCMNVYHRMTEWINSEMQVILLHLTVCPLASGVLASVPLAVGLAAMADAARAVPLMAISVLPHQQPGSAATFLPLLWSFRFLFLLLIFYSIPQLGKTQKTNLPILDFIQ